MTEDQLAEWLAARLEAGISQTESLQISDGLQVVLLPRQFAREMYAQIGKAASSDLRALAQAIGGLSENYAMYAASADLLFHSAAGSNHCLSMPRMVRTARPEPIFIKQAAKGTLFHNPVGAFRRKDVY
jgi:hypothetical protein